MLKRMMKFLVVLIVMVFSLTTNRSFASNEDLSRLTIMVDAEVETLLIDPQGNQKGFDPSTNSYVSQIPNAGRWVDEIPGIPPVRMTGVERPITGTYILKIIGLDQRTYGGGILTRDSSGTAHELSFIGLTSTGLISTYTITYDPTPGVKPTVVRVATIQSTRQDVTLSYNVGWITNAGIVKSLLAKLDAAESSINRGQKKTAANQLNAFINEVKAQTTFHIKPECAKMLIEDAEYILGHL